MSPTTRRSSPHRTGNQVYVAGVPVAHLANYHHPKVGACADAVGRARSHTVHTGQAQETQPAGTSVSDPHAHFHPGTRARVQNDRPQDRGGKSAFHSRGGPCPAAGCSVVRPDQEGGRGRMVRHEEKILILASLCLLCSPVRRGLGPEYSLPSEGAAPPRPRSDSLQPSVRVPVGFCRCLVWQPSVSCGYAPRRCGLSPGLPCPSEGAHPPPAVLAKAHIPPCEQLPLLLPQHSRHLPSFPARHGSLLPHTSIMQRTAAS